MKITICFFLFKALRWLLLRTSSMSIKIISLWSTGEPDQTDSHQIQPGRVHQVPRPHRGVHSVHRGCAARFHRGLLPPSPLPPQAEGEAHQPGHGHRQRCYCHLSGRRCYCICGELVFMFNMWLREQGEKQFKIKKMQRKTVLSFSYLVMELMDCFKGNIAECLSELPALWLVDSSGTTACHLTFTAEKT